jgi:TRAP-type mannitol/chloroaromatic compound transport system substrate-binding protein
MMDAAFKEATALYSELSDTNPTWKKIYSDLSNFRRDQNLWFRLTEAANDDFMQAARL